MRRSISTTSNVADAAFATASRPSYADSTVAPARSSNCAQRKVQIAVVFGQQDAQARDRPLTSGPSAVAAGARAAFDAV